METLFEPLCLVVDAVRPFRSSCYRPIMLLREMGCEFIASLAMPLLKETREGDSSDA